MKITIGYEKYVEETITLPKKYEFYFNKDEDDYTDKDWEMLDNFNVWLETITGEDTDCDIISCN